MMMWQPRSLSGKTLLKSSAFDGASDPMSLLDTCVVQTETRSPKRRL